MGNLYAYAMHFIYLYTYQATTAIVLTYEKECATNLAGKYNATCIRTNTMSYIAHRPTPTRHRPIGAPEITQATPWARGLPYCAAAYTSPTIPVCTPPSPHLSTYLE